MLQASTTTLGVKDVTVMAPKTCFKNFLLLLTAKYYIQNCSNSRRGGGRVELIIGVRIVLAESMLSMSIQHSSNSQDQKFMSGFGSVC